MVRGGLIMDLEVWIVTRDINGKRREHCLWWNDVCSYIQENLTDEDEILLVVVADACVYSALVNDPITKMGLLGFFA
jgi:hypothetical protein